MNKIKMLFQLTKDEDGYPPDDTETLWVEEVGRNLYRVDNIPFYVNDLSPDDIVEGKVKNDILEYSKTVSKSKSSVIRIVFFKKEIAHGILGDLVANGCRWEGSHLSNLFSLEIPNPDNIDSVRRILSTQERDGVLDYEESSLRSASK